MTPSRRRRSVEQLQVLMNNVSVGRLERHSSGAMYFRYVTDWLGRDQSFPISRQFPLGETAYTGDKVRGYFDNLLPDVRQARERLAARSGATSTQPFDLLTAIGRDCVGALQFYPEGERPPAPGPARGKALTENRIADLIKNLRVQPLGIQADSDFRISIAGVQDKTALLKRRGKWLMPDGPTPTTHILKPPIGPLPDGPDLTYSVENEWLCLKLSDSIGLQTAQAEIERFGEVKVLSVERFDRHWSGTRLFRLPQEDMCQALGFGPEKKYESEGGPGILQIMKLLNESDQRDADRKAFFKAQVFFWLIAAIDGHAKNFSVSLRPSGFVLAPLYDIMSADPHINKKTLPKQKVKLAMAVGTSRHWRVQEIRVGHWLQTAKAAKFAKIEDLLEEVVRDGPSAIEKVQKSADSHVPAHISTPIFSEMSRRLKVLKAG